MNNTITLPDLLRQKYRGLRHLLSANTEVLEMMADIEADLLHSLPGECLFRENITGLIERTLLLVQDLNLLSNERYRELYEIHGKIEAEIRKYLRANSPLESRQFLFRLTEVDASMAAEVGGKAANLGEISKLQDCAVPPGFVITTAAYRFFLQENNLNDRIRSLLKDLSLISDHHLFSERTEGIRGLIRNASVPAGVAEAISEGVRNSAPTALRWAVRSSALGEDGRLSYAGQYDTLLNVERENLQDAYRSVLASRYSERAMRYRVAVGSAELDTPMAVLFMPMVNARLAGVLYTQDPEDAKSDRMLINAVRGLAEEMIQGQAVADVFMASRSEPGIILEHRPAPAEALQADSNVSFGSSEVSALVRAGLDLEKHFGRPQDIEWASDERGELVILQARELRLAEYHPQALISAKLPQPILSGGTTVFPGLSVGEAWVLHPGRNLNSVPEAALLVVEQASPDLAIVLLRIAGLIATYGNPAGHAATLIREFAVPCVFGMANATRAVTDGQLLSLDATRRAIYEGVLWPNVQDRVRLRVRHPVHPKSAGFLKEHILALNLVDPQAASFRPKSCSTIHDIIRFVHEKAIETVFDLGDRQARQSAKSATKLETTVPLNMRVLNLGGGIAPRAREIRTITPADITSVPFQALWRGITSPGIQWTGRSRVSAAGFASVVASSISHTGNSVRGLGDYNYLMVATDYLCLNARLAYHFAMVDAMVGDVPENNYVNFRFRGGGAGSERRSLRAQFLAQVLLRSNFGVNRQGDLVTAWLRRYPLDASEQGLVTLGKLMGCARQLDMILDSPSDVGVYAEKFLHGDYESFA